MKRSAVKTALAFILSLETGSSVALALVRCAGLRAAHAGLFFPHAYICVMTFLRIKTIKGKRYLYSQTSVRKGKKVRSIMQYVCSLGWIAAAAASPGYIGSKGHQSTDKRSIKHQDTYDRERHAKRMEIQSRNSRRISGGRRVSGRSELLAQSQPRRRTRSGR
jgi:hypothetical protein